ncbi:MAG TPA: succinylglutamate desuccinylase/aspartoacylase family protein [Ensifer sp.]|uniref:succinylglutamate desuccinylase/aspartoacylase domain-containing protein n=1 Tax=Ensifer sp. TaxID=1872086 RepID=UPI002E14A48D|nr:succinylglutamate desuccinylase/aspartoacylase family protein [Ensifer sp.]
MNVQTKILTAENGFGGHLALRTVRFGIPGGRPKVYIQAGTHTEELPGPLVLHHLEQILGGVDADAWQGEVILVPFANPIGLTQAISGNPIGRLELASGMNFNLSWPSLPAPSEMSATQQLRNATALTALGQIRLEILRMAHDADIVLDIHCCMEPAVSFAFVDDQRADNVRTLAAALNLDAVFTSPASSSGTFTDVITQIKGTRGRGEASHPSMVATLELRSNRDVDDRMAHLDALGLKAYLHDTGALRWPGEAIAVWAGILAPYSSTHAVVAEVGGVFLPRVTIRQEVKQGQLIGEILIPVPTGSVGRTSVHAPCDGLVISHADPSKILHPGASTCILFPTSPICGPVRAYFDTGSGWA